MKISNFSDKTGLSIQTIRYYMSIGLLHPEKNDQYWDFSQEDLERAEEILRYKKCGFSLQTIASILHLKQDPVLSEPEERRKLLEFFAQERERILAERRELEFSLRKLNVVISRASRNPEVESANGIPLPLFALICCPFCNTPLLWNGIRMEQNQVTCGDGRCACGFRVSVEDGILIVADITRPLIPPVDEDLSTLQHRTPQDVSYIEGFNQWIKSQLEQQELDGKIIFEDMLNTACFLHWAIADLSGEANYILCDTSLHVVRYYMSSIRTAYPHRNILFLVDDGIHHPLKPGCLDIIIDYASSEVYQKYGYPSSFKLLQRYAHNGTIVAGRFSARCKLQRGHTENLPMRYQLPTLLSSMRDNGITILAEKMGVHSLDPAVYTDALPGDVIKPYAFIGQWNME